MSGADARRPALLVGVAAVLTAAAVALAVWRPVRLGADDWTWPAVEGPAWDRAVAPGVCLALLGALALAAWHRAERLGRLAEAGLLAALVCVAFLAEVAVGRQAKAGYHESLFALGLPKASAYHEAARSIGSAAELAERLRGFEEEVLRRPFRVQLSTHPAGPVVLFWGLNQVFAGSEAAARRFVRWCEDWLAEGMRLEESALAAALFSGMTAAERAGLWLASLVLRLAACLVLVPAWVVARGLSGRRTAWLAAAFAGAIPSLLLFSPGLDQAYPVLALAAAWLGYRAGERRSRWRAAACGAVVFAGLLFTLAFAVVGGWAALLALVGLRRQGRAAGGAPWTQLLEAAAAGLLVPAGALALALGYQSFAVWWACWVGNAQFNALTQRSYWTWLWLNPLEFAAGLGVPVACLFARRAAGETWALVRRQTAGRDWPLLVVAGLLVGLDVLGANRGEVPRLWMFLMPACAVGAAAEVDRYPPFRRAMFAALFALQAVQVVAFKATVNVLGME